MGSWTISVWTEGLLLAICSPLYTFTTLWLTFIGRLSMWRMEALIQWRWSTVLTATSVWSLPRGGGLVYPRHLQIVYLKTLIWTTFKVHTGYVWLAVLFVTAEFWETYCVHTASVRSSWIVRPDSNQSPDMFNNTIFNVFDRIVRSDWKPVTRAVDNFALVAF